MTSAVEPMTSTVEAGGGLRAAGGGQPRLAELPLATQLLTGSSIAFDLALRTVVASIVTVPGLLSTVRMGPARQLDELAFYRTLAERRDAGASFPPPSGPARVTELPPPPRSFTAPGGSVQMLRFESPFEAVNPALRSAYAAHRENRIAWAQHWRHDGAARPTLAVIHGFGASPYWFNSLFFSLPWLYRKGYDVLLYLLPFHGVRQARAAFSGWGLFAHGFAHFNEAIAHAVHDFRLLLEHLLERGVPQVALTGLSLGGYVSALLAAVEPRLAAVVPNAPVVEVGALARQWFPANLAVAAGLRLGGIGWDELGASVAVNSPLTYPPLIDRSQLMIIGGLGDRLAPPEQARWLWEHWQRPRLHWFPGSHVLHARRGLYLKEMLAFMREAGFA
jgi:pimeloyl-ACP methyl ester carboxylesterase